MKTSRTIEVRAALGKAGAYEFAWNVSRRVAQVCWPAATAAKARGSVLTSMVADAAMLMMEPCTRVPTARKNRHTPSAHKMPSALDDFGWEC